MFPNICKQDRTGEEQDDCLEFNRYIQTEPRETAPGVHYYLNPKITKKDVIKLVMK